MSAENITSFNKLYNEYYDRFVRFANVYVRDAAIAEDIAVDALMYYWETASQSATNPISRLYPYHD